MRDRYIREVDIILSEGFKVNPHPKIEVIRSEMKHSPLCTAEDNLMAIVSDEPVERGVPCFDIDDIQGVANLIEDRFLKGKAA